MTGALKRTATVAALVAALFAAAAGGYWFGQRPGQQSASSPAPAGAGKGERRILYYRHPMGLPDTSPTPKKDPMGMDYVPVYEGDDAQPAQQAGDNAVAIAPDRVQKLGVSFATVERGNFSRPVRAVGKIDIDERRRVAVAPKFEGWIEVLHVNTTGQTVQRGQPLLEVYSPELVSAQREYLLAQQSLAKVAGSTEAESGMQKIAEASLARLRNWDITDDDLRSLVASGTPTRRLTLRAPTTGTVLEKPAVQGMRFMPGDMLFKIADLSSVWVIADVFEQELASVKVGQIANVQVNAYPGRRFSGRVSYIYPTVNAETRTAQIRIELPNPGMQLKPSMYAEVEIAAGQKPNVLMIPSGAALTTGTRSVVLVARDAGRFEPREVQLGMRSDKLVEVVTGLKEGERVVASANFLIDAESNLRSALGAIGGHGGAGHGAPAGGGGSPPAAAAGRAGADKVASTSPVAQNPSGGAAGAITVRHGGEGTVTQVDAGQLQVTLNHEAIPSLKWPAMEMPFAVRSAGIVAGVKPGQRVRFELEGKGSEFVITRITPLTGPAAAPVSEHKAH